MNISILTFGTKHHMQKGKQHEGKRWESTRKIETKVPMKPWKMQVQKVTQIKTI
jgi:hypothetical protein